MQPDPELLIASGERESVRSPDRVGVVIDARYRVLGRLGSGGMADVYEVEHVGLGRIFALKLLQSELAGDAMLVGRFEREARAIARLQSEHIVAIVDSGVHQGAPFFVMERLYGDELRRLLGQAGPLPIQRALHIALDVCRALTVAHAAGVVHRDLKPENLFITRSAQGTDLCKVLDFGVAKLTGENPTLPGTLMGTARYMAPEQINQSSEIGPTTDVFSLAVILYECLTGIAPFAADTLERVLFRIITEAPPPLLELRPEVPPALVAVIEMALSKAAAERPQSAAAFGEALAQFTVESWANSSSTLGDDHTLIDAGSGPTAGIVKTLKTAEKAEATGRPLGLSLLRAALIFGAGLGLGALLGRSSSTAVPSVASQPSADAASSSGPAPVPSHAATSTSMASQGSASPLLPLSPPPRTPAARVPAKASSTSPSSGTPTSAAPPLFFPQDGATKR
jgi:serine/threonine-protein kinase